MITGNGGRASSAFRTLENWSTQNQDSKEEARRLAAAANRFSVELFHCGQRLKAASEAEGRASLECDRLEAVIYQRELATLKFPQNGQKGMSDTAAVELAKRKVYEDEEYLDAQARLITARATRRSLEVEIMALEKLSDQSKFSARASAGAVSKEYVDVK